MNSRYIKFFKYLYIIGASLFLVFMYRRVSPEIFIFGGGVSLLMFVIISPLFLEMKAIENESIYSLRWVY